MLMITVSNGLISVSINIISLCSKRVVSIAIMFEPQYQAGAGAYMFDGYNTDTHSCRRPTTDEYNPCSYVLAIACTCNCFAAQVPSSWQVTKEHGVTNLEPFPFSVAG